MSWDVPTIKSEAFASMSGVVHLMVHLKSSDSERDIYLTLLDRVRAAYEQFDRSELFSVVLARGLSVYSSVFEKYDETNATDLAELAERFPFNESIAICWTQKIAVDFLAYEKRREAVDTAVAISTMNQVNETRDRFPES